MSAFWQAILDVFRAILETFHTAFEPVFGIHSWGWAIIALTVAVRILLLPLAIKQTRSMRAMQQLQPKIKKLQSKYKVDRELLRKDPETYRAKKAKLNEEMMALYREEGVNPAGGCLPLLAQAPIFFALFSVLRDYEPLRNAEFYFFTDFISPDSQTGQGLGAYLSSAGWPGYLLILMMAGTMFWSMRQMSARTTMEGVQAQQQKIMMYVMPVFLAVISFNFPMGVILYWVTTNFWQMGQQAIILREVGEAPVAAGDDGDAPKKAADRPKKKPASGTAKDAPPAKPPSRNGDTPTRNTRSKAKGTSSGHTPRRGDRSA
ncbi:MAG: membrane protein insertase YidC [Actinomycetes bacterium]